MALWTPLDLGAKLPAWWDADNPSDGAVTTWTDKISGLAPTQGTAGNRPVRSATSFNGFPGVTFDGTNDSLRVVGAITLLPTGGGPVEIWGLVSQDDVTVGASVRDFFMYGSEVAKQLVGPAVYETGGASRFFLNWGAAGYLADTVATFQGKHIVGGLWSTASMAGWIDGVPTNPTSVVGTGLNIAAGATDRINIGSSINATTAEFWQGVIRHIFVTTELTTDERQKLEGWMAHDVALTSLLPADHPYKTTAPTTGGPVTHTMHYEFLRRTD